MTTPETNIDMSASAVETSKLELLVQLAWMRPYLSNSHRVTIDAAIAEIARLRASSTRSEVVEECAQVCDAYATGTYEHTCHIEFEEAASRIRALASPQAAAPRGEPAAALTGYIITWICGHCGWANDNNTGPCRKCGKN